MEALQEVKWKRDMAVRADFRAGLIIPEERGCGRSLTYHVPLPDMKVAATRYEGCRYQI
jgi:hypothetical protein